MKTDWKSRAYSNTKVPYERSQIAIGKLLINNGIFEKQFTDTLDKTEIVFLKELVIESSKMKVGVKITIPNITDKNKNQLYRALFYYLKAKFESLTFGFVEEYNEAFVKEFMPYLITDRTGKTVSDMVLPKFNQAISYTKKGEQLYLDSKENQK